MSRENEPDPFADGTPLAEDEVDLARFEDFAGPGVVVAGYYCGRTQEPGLRPDGKPFIAQHHVATDDGMVHFNEVAQLTPLATIPAGTWVRVLYLGEGEKSAQGNRIRRFRITGRRADWQAMLAARLDSVRAISS